jgi:hypothetical protein
MLPAGKGVDLRVVFLDQVQNIEDVIDIGGETGGDTYSVRFERGELLAQARLQAHIKEKHLML